MEVEFDHSILTDRLEKYAATFNRDIWDLTKDEAKQTAARLEKLTPPYNAKQGKNAIMNDINRVFLRDSWFEDKFKFTNEEFGKRVVDSVGAQDVSNLKKLLSNGKLSKIKPEGFNPSLVKNARGTGGRVKYKQPFSFPVGQEKSIDKFIKDEQKKAGLARSGWSWCVRFLGGSSPSWLNKQGTGRAFEDKENKTVSITNTVSYFDKINQKLNVVSKALAGRQKDMANKIDRALKEAAAKVGFES